MKSAPTAPWKCVCFFGVSLVYHRSRRDRISSSRREISPVLVPLRVDTQLSEAVAYIKAQALYIINGLPLYIIDPEGIVSHQAAGKCTLARDAA